MQTRQKNYWDDPRAEDSHVVSTVIVRVVDDTTKLPLAGVMFKLLRDGRPLAVAITGPGGSFHLDHLITGEYELVEASPAHGYLQSPFSVRISISDSGRVCLDGIPANCAVLERHRSCSPSPRGSGTIELLENPQ